MYFYMFTDFHNVRTDVLNNRTRVQQRPHLGKSAFGVPVSMWSELKKSFATFFDIVNSSIFAKLILRAHRLGWQGRYTVLLYQVFCIRLSICAYQMENQKHLNRS